MTESCFPVGVNKIILSCGNGDLPIFLNGGKVLFHYLVSIVNEDKSTKELDNSRKTNKPFELLLGKKFKLDLWETLIKSMRLNEIAEFICPPEYVGSYPVVSKSLRDMYRKENDHDHSHHHSSGHMCGFAALSQGLGYKDLDDFVKDPKPLKFTFELLKVEQPGTYEKDLWSMSLDEKRGLLPQWKDEGNAFYKAGDLDKALEKYSDALGSLEQLSTREKPNSDEWLGIEKMKIPFLLNYAQCMIEKKEYYKAIEHLTTVIEKDPDNVKAFYRRGKAYHLVYNFTEAYKDYTRAKELDKTLEAMISNELQKIKLDEKRKNYEDKKNYEKAFR